MEVTKNLATSTMSIEVQDVSEVATIEKAIQTATKNPIVRKDIQAKVDKYVELHSLQKKLEARLKELRQDIEPYMLEKNIMRIEDTKGTGAIVTERSQRPEVTAKYTTYNVMDIEPFLDDPELQKFCITRVVDRDSLEYLVKSGQVSREVYEYKITKEVNKLIVKKY